MSPEAKGIAGAFIAAILGGALVHSKHEQSAPVVEPAPQHDASYEWLDQLAADAGIEAGR
jgi:hypothetical protein